MMEIQLPGMDVQIIVRKKKISIAMEIEKLHQLASTFEKI